MIISHISKLIKAFSESENLKIISSFIFFDLFCLFNQPQAFADFKGHLPKVSSFVDSCEEIISRNSKNQKKEERCWKKLDQIEDSMTVEQDMRKELLRLDIYFQSMTTSLIKEEPKYSVRISIT